MKSILVCGVLLLGLAGNARANSYGYVCAATLQAPQAGNGEGNFGAINFTFYTGPSCTGSFVAGPYICSTGATYAYCSTQLYTEAGLMAVFGAMQRAQSTNEKVWVGVDSSWILSWLYFYPAGY